MGTFDCAEIITSSSLVYLDPVSGKLYLADRLLGRLACGYVVSGASEDEELEVFRLGVLYGLSGLTKGETLWLDIAGQVRMSPPIDGVFQQVGQATSISSMFVEIQEPVEFES